MATSNIPDSAWEIAEKAYPSGGTAAAMAALSDYNATVRQVQTHMGARQIKYTGPPLSGNRAPDSDNVPSAITRRCRSKMCIERFVPVNAQHWYHEPACHAIDQSLKWTVDEILAEEGSLAIGTSMNELAKRAFAQKNTLFRQVSRLTSNRDYMAYLIEELGDRGVGRIEAVPIPKRSTGTSLRELIVILSDWQLGKWENGVGVDVMQNVRIPRIIDAVLAVLRRERDSGYQVDTIRLVFAGDMIEGCWIYKGQNVTGLDRTSNSHRIMEQIELCARLQAEMAMTFAAHVPNVIVESVPGNHGRPNAKSEFADPADNFDSMAVRWAADKATAQKNIAWSRNDEWFTEFEVLGHAVIATHGDKWRSNFDALNTLLPRWILSGEFAEPSLFITAHRHNYHMCTIGSVRVIQNGALDGGSGYYTQQTGMSNPPIQTIVVASSTRICESVWPIDFE